MNQRFRAMIAEEVTGGSRASVRDLALVDLPDEDILVRVSHSTLNYKDALAVTGKGKICRFFPMVCGIDLAGTVVESRTPDFKAGDAILINGFGMSERHWGGYTQFARVNQSWPIPIPPAFSAEQAMGLGTAGYTAMLCVQALEERGVTPADGPVLVSGATGGVGSVAVMLLAQLGFDVIAATGRAADNRAFLTELGARDILEREELSRKSRPLESERWSGAIDCVGGDVLASILAQTKYGGTVAACGLAGSATLSTTVMPFILRSVALIGVDSVMASSKRRRAAWARLAELVDVQRLSSIYVVKPLTQVPQLAEDLLAGRSRGRVVVDVNA